MAPTLYGCPVGQDARVLARLARLEGPSVLAVVTDEARLNHMRDLLAFFAPDVSCLIFPAWDCLPYDRTGPSHDVTGIRVATLSTLVEAPPRILLTSVAAWMQRVPPRHAMRDARLCLRTGDQTARETLESFLVTQGYQRTDVVRTCGDYALRGCLVDLFPPAHHDGDARALRVDFFGDSIDSLKYFDPLTQTTCGTLDAYTLRAVTECPHDPDSIRRFRTRYRELFGIAGSSDSLYTHVSDGRPASGVEHWLPLFYDTMETLDDYMPDARRVMDEALPVSIAARHAQIIDFYDARQQALRASPAVSKREGFIYNPIPPALLYRAPETLHL